MLILTKKKSIQISIYTRVVLITIAILWLSSCATYTPPGSDWEGYGFFSGWIHGLLLPFAIIAKVMSFFLSLIGIDYMNKFEIIGDPNSGTSYYIGYLIGLFASIFGGKSAINR